MNHLTNVLSLFSWKKKTNFIKKTRKHLLDSKKKIKKQLENTLKNVNENLDDHRSGKTTLPNNKVEHYEHLQRAYEHQLDDLSRELDEEEIQRKLEAYNKLKNDRTGDEL